MREAPLLMDGNYPGIERGSDINRCIHAARSYTVRYLPAITNHIQKYFGTDFFVYLTGALTSTVES
jgi:hypothetical protein